MTQSTPQLLQRLWSQFSARRRFQFVLLLFLMILASFAEILSIGAVLPFLAILTDPGRVYIHPVAQPFINSMGFTDPKQLLLPLTISFGLAALIAGTMRLVLLGASIHLSYTAGADLSISIYRRTLYQPYAVHVDRNSSEIIDGISNKTNNAIYLINMTLNLISSSVMMLAILMALLIVDPLVALTAFSSFSLIYISFILMTRRRLLINSQIIARESTLVIKSLQEGLGGIRDVLIDGSQATYCKVYSNADQPLRRAQGSNQFINYAPRYAMEALGMVVIAGLAYMLAHQVDGISKAIPVLGALALGAQRLLPVLQQAYSSWSSIQGGFQSLLSIIELLEQPLPDFAEQLSTKPLYFREKICLKQVSFRYNSQTNSVLKDINLTINKGDRVGLIGATGSGKSTLLDIVMGLLHPSKGTIEIDGQIITSSNHRAWQSHIAHVPQSIYLADSTIAENIAFGVPNDQVDHDRVEHAAKQAQIADTIESWPQKYQTFVGERGIRLSGGQRQRIGIARALYKKADVIIFDEATSALDNDTENAVMQAIEGLNENLTILIIAHRISTLRKCNVILELVDGEIKRCGNFQSMASIQDL